MSPVIYSSSHEGDLISQLSFPSSYARCWIQRIPNNSDPKFPTESFLAVLYVNILCFLFRRKYVRSLKPSTPRKNEWTLYLGSQSLIKHLQINAADSLFLHLEYFLWFENYYLFTSWKNTK